MTPKMHRLVDQAVSDVATGPECAAALSAARRLGLEVWGDIDGYHWDGERYVADATLPPLPTRKALSWGNPNEELQVDQTEERTAEVAYNQLRRSSKAERVGLMLELLRRPQGATVAELMDASGYTEPTVGVRLSKLRAEGFNVRKASGRYVLV